MCECTICLSDFTAEGVHIPIALGCGHSFGKSCLRNLMSINGIGNLCPTCRVQISKPMDQLHPNYALIALMKGNADPNNRKRKSPSEAYMEGAVAVIAKYVQTIARSINKMHAEEERNKTLVLAAKERIASLELQLFIEKKHLSEIPLPMGENPPVAASLLDLQNRLQMMNSEAYLLETQRLCKSVMEQRFLAFSDIEYSFDMDSLLKRVNEGVNKPMREYYLSLVKLFYHYEFPLIEDKFNVWKILNNRTRVVDAQNKRWVSQKLRDLLSDVPIQIKFDNGKVLDVMLGSTYDEVKELAWKKFKVPLADRNLYFNGSCLVDGKLSNLFNLTETSVFSCSSRKVIQTTIETSARRFYLHVKSSDTILVLKQFIEVYEVVPVNLQSLVYDGKVLEDDRSVSDYNFQLNSVIKMTKL